MYQVTKYEVGLGLVEVKNNILKVEYLKMFIIL